MKNNINKLYKPIFTILSILIAISIGHAQLHRYITPNFNLVLGLILAPFIIYGKETARVPYRFPVLSIISLGLFPILKIHSVFLLGLLLFILYQTEMLKGKLNIASIYLLFLLSPAAEFVFQVFGFPIRLQLTEIAVKLLSFVNHDIFSEGNIIFLNGNQFRVDPECMGLNLSITGFLLSLVILSFAEKKIRKQLRLFSSLFYLSVSFILIIFANLFRILGIVIFLAMPGTILHEMIGLLCLCIYVAIPVYFIAKLFTKTFGLDFKFSKINLKIERSQYLITCLILITLTLVANVQKKGTNNTNTFKGTVYLNENYDKEILEEDISKFSNDSFLVYLKPLQSLFAAEHTPLICWKGTGYTFIYESEIKINNINVYYAQMTNKNDTLHTIWYYDNGNHKTNSQIKWRWLYISTNQVFSLVNITSASREKLFDEAEQIM